MFGSRSFGALQTSSNSLDVPVASLAGLAIAFLAFAAPADLLEQLVAMTGIADLVPAAQPPLGLTARVALSSGGALIAFGIALLVLRWLGRFGTTQKEEVEEAPTMEPPRLRRRDIHPDAPARAPLLAAHEVGEPELELKEIAPEPEPEPEPEPQPLPEPIPEFVLPPAAPLLARKPDRVPGARPAAPLEIDASAQEVAEPVERPAAEKPQDQAGAYALSLRNWADFEPDPDPEPQSEPQPDIRYPSLTRASLRSEAQVEEDSPPPISVPVDEPSDIEEPEEPAAPLEANWYAMQSGEPEVARQPEPAAELPAAAPEAWTSREPIRVEPEPAAEAPEPEPLPSREPIWVEPEPVVEAPEPEPLPSAEPVWAEPEAVWAETEPVAIEPEPLSVEAIRSVELPAESAPPTPVGSIAELMERLEKGLARHRGGPAAPAPVSPAATPIARAAAPRAISPDPSDDRLQNAIESLQRFASRQD